MSPRSLLVCLLALAVGAPALQAQLHKDGRLGFQIKPPGKFDAVALNTKEVTTVAKWQSTQKEFSQQNTAYNSTFEVLFYANAVLDDELSRAELLDGTWQAIESSSGYAEELKSKTAKIAGYEATYKHIQPTNGGLTLFATVIDQDDGLFVLIGRALSERFEKYDADFLKAARSFKRIEKADTSVRQAELAQMDEQERFLQEQIDKLPEGWDHLRTNRYLFLFNAEKNWVKELAVRIEAVRDLLEQYFPPSEPIEAISIVRVCASRDQYMAYGGSETSGGYWSSFHRELVVFDSPPRATTEATINHEAFHQYIYYFYGELAPHSWYNEGTGDYFAGAKMTRTYRVTEYGDAPGGIARKSWAKEACRLMRAGLTSDPMCGTPLRQLMAFRQADYYTNGLVKYGQGWALIHMLRESKRLKPAWQRILGDYLVFLVEARHEVATQVMKRELDQAEKRSKGSSAELSDKPEAYYAKADTDDIQRLAFQKTFAGWTDEDWEDFNTFYMDYVEDL